MRNTRESTKVRRATAAARRAGIYARISRKQDDDGEGSSLGVKRQVEDCRAKAEERGFEVVDVYPDDDKSAYSGKPRPEFVRMCDDLKAGVIDTVIVWHADRLHRSPRELEDFIDLIEATGALVVSVTGGDTDLETTDGRFKARIEVDVARRESEDKSRRLRRKHMQLAEQGMPNGGRRPMGYQRVGLKKDPAAGNSDTRQLVKDPVEAPIVAEVIERVARGETLTRIADDLNDRGAVTSTGSAWTIWTVRRISLNGLYANRRIHKGTDVGEGTWPAIVDEATWRRAVALLNAPDRMKRRSARRYLLTGGILICGKCLDEGKISPLRSKPRHSRTGPPVATYVCPLPKLGGCGGISILAEPTEHVVADEVVNYVESKAFAKALRSRTGGDRKAASEVKVLSAELDELETAYQAGALSLREYIRFRDAKAVQLADAQNRMAGNTRASVVGRFAGQAGALRAWWDDDKTTLDQKQAVVRAVVEYVVIDPVGKHSNGFDESRVRTPKWA